MEQSEIVADLDLDQVARVIYTYASFLDREIGRGDTTERMLEQIVTNGFYPELLANTHIETGSLLAAWRLEKGKTPKRGFWDPGGLQYDIYVDPEAPYVADIGSMGSSPGVEQERPYEYAPKEFSRVGSKPNEGPHDAPGTTMESVGEYWESGWQLFSLILSSKLNQLAPILRRII